MKKTITKTLTLATLLSSTIAFADLQNGNIYEYFHNYRSIRALGMGSVRTTTALYDDALFSNPARHSFNPKWKLTLLNPFIETNSGVLKTVSDAKSVKFDGSNLETLSKFSGRNHHLRFSMTPLALYIPNFFFDTSFAFAPLLNFQINAMLGKNHTAYAPSLIDGGLNAGLSKNVYQEQLYVGANIHALYRASSDASVSALDLLKGKKLKFDDPSTGAGQGAGIDFDFGAYYKIPVDWAIRPNAAVSINNVLNNKYSLKATPIKDVTTKPFNQPRVLNMGGNLEFPEFGPLSNGVVALEVNDIMRKGSLFKHVHLGGEVKLISFLSFRAGINQGYPTAGFGIDIPLVKIDLATSGEELGLNSGTRVDRRYAAQIALEI